jgi:hypothetical protein
VIDRMELEAMMARMPKALADEVRAQLETQVVEADRRRNKYHAERTQADGVWFDSKREATRYRTLKLLQLAGKVLWFCLQPRFVLPGGATYWADFVVAWEDGRTTVEDVKSAGTRTKTYRLKKRQVEALYRVRIEEV